MGAAEKVLVPFEELRNAEILYPPELQEFHNYISSDIDEWLQLHFGDTSFGTTGCVTIGYKNPRRGQNVLPLARRSIIDLRAFIAQMHFSDQIDYYITANTTYSKHRREDSLFGLWNIVFDVDGHTIEDPEERESVLQEFDERLEEELLKTGVIVRMNSRVKTGRGRQLWWALKPCYGGKKKRRSTKYLVNSRKTYEKVRAIMADHIRDLIERHGRLRELEFDSKTSTNIVGFYRLPLTVNTSAQCVATYEIFHTERYDLRELKDLEPLKLDPYFEDPDYKPEVLQEPHTEPVKPHIPLQPSDIELIKGFEGTGFKRIKQLVELRNDRMKKGKPLTRNYFCFAIYNSMRMHCDHEEAMEMVHKFNEGYGKHAMTDAELAGTVCTAAEIGGYKYSNEKLIELLDITPEEQKKIRLFPYVGSYVPGRGAKPNASRDLKRATLKAQRDYDIITLFKEGVSQAEIARRMKISKNTVGKVVREYKNQTEEVTEPVVEDAQITETQEAGAKRERPKNGAIYGNIPPNIPRRISRPSGMDLTQDLGPSSCTNDGDVTIEVLPPTGTDPPDTQDSS